MNPSMFPQEDKIDRNYSSVVAEQLKSNVAISPPLEHPIFTENKLEDNELPPSPTDVKENIKQKFLVEMPDDFYQFWEFCQSICQKNTLGMFVSI